MLNTKVHIFTYGLGGNEKSWSWKTVVPDPVMAPYSEFGPGTVTEMYLYNSDSTHFDLLVENNSRLAVMGFISIGKEKEVEIVEIKETKVSQGPKMSQGAGIGSKDQWHTVASTKKPQDKDHSCPNCEKSFSDRSNLFNHMNEHIPNKNPNVTKFKFSGVCVCDKCDAIFITNTLLHDHEREFHFDSGDVQELNDRPVIKPQQFHCALIESTGCDFQCDSREVLKQHVDETHRGKTQLQCSVCNVYFRDLNDLSNHMSMSHIEMDDDTQILETNQSEYICRNCQNTFNNNNDLNKHILTEHPSYKPCRNFATNSCEYQECRFYHTILKKGECICYKCGDRFSKKSLLLNHLKIYHNEPCLKYQQGTCTYGTQCVYNHIITGVNNVERQQLNNKSTAPYNHYNSDFPNLPTTEKRLVGTRSSMEELMMNMNNLINQMSQMSQRMTRIENVITSRQN